jgi:hypothetical protein
MPKYKVAITRIAYADFDVEIEAEDEEQAKNLAVNAACDSDLMECSAEYQVDYVKEIQ